MTKTRTESDSFGPLEVPVDKYWGAQTARSLINLILVKRPWRLRLCVRWV